MSGIEDNFLIDLEFNGDLKAAPNGDLAQIKGRANLVQALFNCLVTIPGSLAHRPGYGVGIQLWQNNIGSIDKQRQLALEIKKQFEQDPRVEKVSGVTIVQDKSNPGKFVVTVKVKAVGLEEFTETFNPFKDIIA